MIRPVLALLAAAALAACGCATTAFDVEDHAAARLAAHDADGFETFISPIELIALRDATPALVVLDARSPDEYAAGHVPGAVSLPGGSLRTPEADPGEGDSQYLFRDAAGGLDIARYERLLGEIGLTRETPVVVYGNHAGKSDGTVAAMILDALGHAGRVRFLDGVGLDQWRDAGHEVETEPTALPPSTYEAKPRETFLWDLNDVIEHVGDGSAVFYDTRSIDEFSGVELRQNARGGRIPGAVHADYAALLDGDKTIRSRDAIEAIFAAGGLPEARAAGRPIVLYCQTSTRVSLPYLLLRELGYENVAVYDASWHEYGNRDDTPVEGEVRADR